MRASAAEKRGPARSARIPRETLHSVAAAMMVRRIRPKDGASTGDAIPGVIATDAGFPASTLRVVVGTHAMQPRHRSALPWMRSYPSRQSWMANS